MAASQARFLGLTARKTNTEYEGQQINQQRTVLSNQSANYYNQLLGMTVPVPPSVDDYTKTVYTFTDGALENTVNSVIAQQGGEFLVSYTRRWTNDHAVVSGSSSIVTRKAVEVVKLQSEDEEKAEDNNDVDTTPVAASEYEYSIGSKTLRPLGDMTNWSEDDYLKTLTDKQRGNLQKEEELYIAQLNEKYGESAQGWQVIYRQDSTSGSWVPSFYKKEDLTKESTVYSSTGSSQSFIPSYTVGSAVETDEVKGAKAKMEQDSSGRYINITLIDGENSVTYALTTNTTTDQAAYNDAMNQYEYDKAQYDKSIENINSKIEIIQTEDKNLELRLKQLDTEQDAIQTEMDAVQKVIEKNTESTFKTFG